jgi:hypothetical protein
MLFVDCEPKERLILINQTPEPNLTPVKDKSQAILQKKITL